jgi:hypothetical protein
MEAPPTETRDRGALTSTMASSNIRASVAFEVRLPFSYAQRRIDT